MSKYVRGITLNQDERALIGSTNGAGSPGKVRLHSCKVTLPDGNQCEVAYQRIGPRSHLFTFQAPVNQKAWVDTHLDGSAATIEREAQGCALDAFLMAQEAEQKEMRRCSVFGSSGAVAGPEPQLPSKDAAKLGGQYAACVKFASGSLLRIGPPRTDPLEVCREIENGSYRSNGQRNRHVVIGICNRSARRWQDPRFVVNPKAEEPPAIKPQPVRKGRRPVT